MSNRSSLAPQPQPFLLSLQQPFSSASGSARFYGVPSKAFRGIVFCSSEEEELGIKRGHISLSSGTTTIFKTYPGGNKDDGSTDDTVSTDSSRD